jgi:hypothetical protein
VAACFAAAMDSPCAGFSNVSEAKAQTYFESMARSAVVPSK